MDVIGKKKMIVRIVLTADLQMCDDILGEHGQLNQNGINAIKKNLMDVINDHFEGVSFADAAVMYKEE
jgi:hypothetical protein